MKRRLRYFFTLMTLCVLSVHGAFAYTNPNHFVDTQWNLQAASGYDSIQVDITPQAEESTSTDGYYFANTVYFRNYTGSNFGGAYAGMQTNGYDGTRYIGKMAIFSVWDVTNGIAESGGTGTSFGGEGTGYSVRLPFNWSVGTSYRLKIYIDQDAASGDRLWAASFTNQSTGAVTRIGRIYVPVARGKIYGPVTFHERYMGGTNCGDIKKSQVRFSGMNANDGAIKATSWSHYAKSQVPECPGLVWLQDDSGGYTSAVGTTKPTPVVQTVTVPDKKAVTPTTPKTTEPVTPAAASTAPVVQTSVVASPSSDNQKVAPTPTTKAAIPLSKSKTPQLIATISLSVAALATGTLFGIRRFYRRRFDANLKKHFPFDADIKRF